MSEHFQSVVFPDAPLESAHKLGVKLIGWMQQQTIIVALASECALGKGYAPANRFYQVAESATDTAIPGLLELVTNGVRLITERTVFHAGEVGFASICPRCGARCDSFEDVGDAIDAWYKGEQPKDVICHTCNHSDDLLGWCFDPMYGFGNLGLTFWNWPVLSSAFLDKLSASIQQRHVIVNGVL